MHKKVLFLATVDPSKDFDKHVDTRRLMRDRTAEWHHRYNIADHVKNVWCGSDYPALSLFTRILGTLNRDMKIINELADAEIAVSPKRALGHILECGHADMIIVSYRVGEAFKRVCSNLPTFAHSQLFLVITDGKSFQVISTEDRSTSPPTMLAADRFRQIVEEASERAASPS